MKFNNKSGTGKLIFFFVLVIAIIFLLASIPRLTLPLAFSYIFSLVLTPIVLSLMKLGFSRSIAICLLFAGLFSFSIYPIVKLVPLIKRESENIQNYLPKIERYFRSQHDNFNSIVKNKIGIEIQGNLIDHTITLLKNSSKSILLSVPKILASLLEWIFLVPLLIFFILLEGRKFKDVIFLLIPNRLFERIYYLTHQFNKQLGDYIFAKFVEASIVGTSITIGLMILDIRFAIIFGLIAGITNVIPYLGPFIGMAPPLIFGAAVHGMGSEFGAILILFLIVNAFDLALIFPILVSKIVNLHPILVVVSVILGSQMMGVVGMIISIPLAAAAKLLLTEIYKYLYQTPSLENFS